MGDAAATPGNLLVQGDNLDALKALLYLGRYLYRGVVQEADILSCKDRQVTFCNRDAKTGKQALRTLPGADFL